jgi:DNA repair protein RecO
MVSHILEEHDPHPQLFDRMLRVVAEMAGDRREQIFLWFQMELLREAGLSPQLAGCNDCGMEIDESERIFFSPARGGTVCVNCEGLAHDRIELDGRLVRMLAAFLKLRSLPSLTRAHTDPLNALLAQHIEQQLSKRLRMPRYVLG